MPLNRYGGIQRARKPNIELIMRVAQGNDASQDMYQVCKSEIYRQ